MESNNFDDGAEKAASNKQNQVDAQDKKQIDATRSHNVAIYKDFRAMSRAANINTKLALVVLAMIVTGGIDVGLMWYTMHSANLDPFGNANINPILVGTAALLTLCLFGLIKRLWKQKIAVFFIYMILLLFVFKSVWQGQKEEYAEMFSSTSSFATQADTQTDDATENTDKSSTASTAIAIGFTLCDSIARTVPGWLFVFSCFAYGITARKKEMLRYSESVINDDAQANATKTMITNMESIQKRANNEKIDFGKLATKAIIGIYQAEVQNKKSEITNRLSGKDAITGQERVMLENKIDQLNTSLESSKTISI